MKHVSKSLGDTTADLVRTSPFYIQEVGWAVIHRHTLKQRRAWMTKWQTSNALVKSQFSLYSFLWYHYIWHWYHIINIFYHVIKNFLVDVQSKHLELICMVHIISMKFRFVSRCTSISIAMNAVIELEVCFYCFERRICIRSVCFAVIHVLNTWCVYIKHPNVYA